MVELRIIAALAENRVIRNKGALPWNIPEDLNHFDELTRGYPVIMGRHTFQLIWKRLGGRPMPHRYNIVLSRTREGFGPDVDLAGYFEEAVSIASYYNNLAYVIGGERVYKQALISPLTRQMRLTHIRRIYEGDAYFPLFNVYEWNETRREYRNGDPKYFFSTYERKAV